MRMTELESAKTALEYTLRGVAGTNLAMIREVSELVSAAQRLLRIMDAENGVSDASTAVKPRHYRGRHRALEEDDERYYIDPDFLPGGHDFRLDHG